MYDTKAEIAEVDQMKISTISRVVSMLLLTTGCSSVFDQDYGVNEGLVASVVTPAQQASEVHVLEAEAGDVLSKGADTWEIFEDDSAWGLEALRKTGGAFFEQANRGPSVQWPIRTSASGTFDVWLRARPNAFGDSVFFEWSGESLAYHWGADTHGDWVWTKLRSIETSAGESNPFTLWAREDLLEIDQLVVQTVGAEAPQSPQ